MGNWQHTAGLSPPQTALLVVGRLGEKRKNGQIFSVPIVYHVLTIF